jgi:hypothetical protein
MPTITIRKQLSVPAAAVWATLADFGNVDWIPGAGDVRVEGEGPGMRRVLSGSGPNPIVEQLLWVDPAGRRLSYEITDNPLPVKRFAAVATVADIGSDAGVSAVSWEVDYEPDGDDELARGAIEAVYGLMADWIEQYVRTR